MLFSRPLRLTKVTPTELFVGSASAPLQVVRIAYTGGDDPVPVRVEGRGVHTPRPVPAEPAPGELTIEVPVATPDTLPGQTLPARVVAGRERVDFDLVVAEPGWTMHMVSHFHYDPVWWNTQASFTSTWQAPPNPGRQMHSFALVRAHLELARREPVYKFVLAEVDYLKPYWDAHPQDRAELRELIAAGRVELMGGAYNEPNTNLTGPETTIRNLVHGVGFQRDVLGGDPRTAWQLDVFGHDPQFPGLAADAGLTSSSWARGPFHQWGPMRGPRPDNQSGDPTAMQFRSEFDWIAPSGRALLTSYMPDHYSSGWDTDAAPTLAEAEQGAYRAFTELRKVATTRNVLWPVGTDHTPPNKWVTAIHHDWNARYVWPRFVCALPSEFFAAVRAELVERDLEPSPQTRDMNPIYTGKDVSFIDTKQASRAAEDAVLDAERFGVFARLLTGAGYPDAALAKAWVQLAFGAHHDAITGSESDQVYLDLLTSWRDAWQLGSDARDAALDALAATVDTSAGPMDARPVVVWNPLTRQRTDLVTVRLPAGDAATGVAPRVVDADGNELPSLVEHGGSAVTFLAEDVGSLGWRTYWLVPAYADDGWQPIDDATGQASTVEISNEHYRVTVDPGRGGGVASLVELATGRELIAAGPVGNELAVYDEYPQHPQAGEGPWHLLPKGPAANASGQVEAESVTALRSPIGQRLVVRGEVGPVRYTQTITLWRGIDRVDCVTTVDEFTGADQLLRLRWPCPVPGALPVSEVGDAVVGRGFAMVDVDSATEPWTLDNPAYTWFGLSSSARVRVGAAVRSVGVAEIVAPSEQTTGPLGRELAVALVRAGVTSTCSWAQLPRYGKLDVDSNLPDVRIALGSPGQNAFTAAVLDAADPAYTEELNRQLQATGRARIWVPAARPLAEVWLPNADLTAPDALPVLVVAGHDEAGLAAAIGALVDDLADAEVVVNQELPQPADTPEGFESRTVALLNRGVPGFAVDVHGTLHASLMRSCTGWPSGIWIDPPPKRTTPDGSDFQLQHWTHRFEYALHSAAGDWREAGTVAASAALSHPLHAALTGGHQGRLPASGSLLQVEPADAVTLGTLKSAGNPLPRGSAEPSDPATAVAVRLVETRGAATTATVRSPLGDLLDGTPADLLERLLGGEPDRTTTTGDGELRVPLDGFEIATVLARPALPKVTATEAPAALGPEAEVAQPLYARYWLHNRGPAPLGGLPAVPHLHPHQVTVPADRRGEPVALRLTVASDRTDGKLQGTVRLLGPHGWPVSPDQPTEVALPAGGYAETEVVLQVPAGTSPGHYPLRAQLTLDRDGLPASWVQTVEDLCVVTVAADDNGSAGELLRLVDGPAAVTLRPGESGRVEVSVATDAYGDLAVEAQLISPWGTWEWAGPPAVGATLPARGSVQLGFDVAPPAWVGPGQWWALVKVMAAGRMLYSPTVPVRVVEP